MADQNQWQVFVVELDDEAGPRRRADRPNVFIGITSIDPVERLEQILRSGKRHPIVRDHAVRLRPDLYRTFPAGSQNDARRQKRKLTERLMRRGFTVGGDVRVWRVYVIELDDAIGPRTNPKLPWVYVGETSIDVEERFKQHMSGARNRKGKLYSNLVKQHGLRLRPDLYESLPVLYCPSDSKQAERRLFDALLEQGYSVRGGH